MPLSHEDRIQRTEHPGAPPGTLTVESGAPVPVMRVMGYGPNTFAEATLTRHEEIQGWMKEWPVTWLDVDGVGDLEIIKALGQRFHVHPLALEDVVHVHQRPKAEAYEDFLFVVVRMVQLGDGLETEQLSVILGEGFVLTFQEGLPGDCLEPVRDRVRRDSGRLRVSGPDYLMYALLDAVVDHYFPLLERYAERLQELEDLVLQGTNDEVLMRIHQIKRELITLRRTIWPVKDMVKQLRPELSSFVTPEVQPYLRDVHDHVDQLLDLIETYHALARSLVELHLSLGDHRANEVMKVLTVVGAIFLPLTFVTGLYGMNFDTDSRWNMPELSWTYGYEFALGLMLGMTLLMLLYFRRRRWL